ncbi:hypothetical protein TELCIR_03884 [Teladorsagia circumcincta]|uniref:Uncharacterized protein n=1 Tax=Teladorsagia circumcincta TaxID=45464 RepID=A0A2G9UV46_TELCI|nr:hypothetical protein TELCIR_03884 [Teladorsagia circumcincta]
MKTLLVVLSCLTVTSEACSTNNNIARDGELITDPSFTFTVSPPVRWTYYPPVAPTGNLQITNFFPGQSMTSAEALQSAQNEVMAAYLEALTEIPAVNTLGVTTTVTYSPDEISNCYTSQPIPGGTKIGYLAGGAVTQIAIVTQQQATATTCPLSTTMIQTGIGPYQEYTKTLTSTLNLRYQALFRSEVTINNN